MRILAKYIKENKIELFGVGINGCMPYSVASLKGFFEAEGVYGLNYALDAEATDFGGNPPYQERLAKRFRPDVTNAEAIDAVKLYRKILASTDEKIEIIEIGYPQVLQSGADEFSKKVALSFFSKRCQSFG